jgi:hypothetical protein
LQFYQSHTILSLASKTKNVQVIFSKLLMTHDADFLRFASQSLDHCGIAFCRKDTRTLGEIIRSLRGCLKSLLHFYIRPPTPQIGGLQEKILQSPPNLGDLGGQRKAVKHFQTSSHTHL